MAEKYGIRSKWGLPKTPGFDDNFMANHTGGSNIPFQDYPSGSVDNLTMNYKAKPQFPNNTAFQQESEFLRKGSSQNAVAGATGNNMKVGMSAAGNAQDNLTKSDVYSSSINPVYKSPEISNVKEVYRSPNITNLKTAYESTNLSNVKEVYNSNDINSFDQQTYDYSVNVLGTNKAGSKTGAMHGSGADPYEEYGGESMASFDKQRPALTKPERPTVLDDSYGKMFPDALDASDMPGPIEKIEMKEILTPGGGQSSLTKEQSAKALSGSTEEFASSLDGPSGKLGGADKAAKGNAGMQAAAAGLAIAGGVAKHQELQKVIGTLKDQRRGLEGAIGGMANETNAAMKASRQNLSEERRQIGALENDALYNQLEKARATKTGGLSSGSVKQVQDELTDTASTRSDVSLSRAEDRAFAAEDAFMAEQFNLRSQRNAQLEELNKQIEEAEKEKTWGPINSIVDAGISVVTVANPAVGMGLSIGKSLLTS